MSLQWRPSAGIVSRDKLARKEEHLVRINLSYIAENSRDKDYYQYSVDFERKWTM